METNNCEGAVQKKHNQPFKRYCQTLDLINDSELIAKYIAAHAEGNHWKEIREGILQVGILEMEIYNVDNRLFMIVETKIDFHWEEAFNVLATLPRQNEWESWMSSFQDIVIGSKADKWKLMNRVFHLYPIV